MNFHFKILLTMDQAWWPRMAQMLVSLSPSLLALALPWRQQVAIEAKPRSSTRLCSNRSSRRSESTWGWNFGAANYKDKGISFSHELGGEFENMQYVSKLPVAFVDMKYLTWEIAHNSSCVIWIPVMTELKESQRSYVMSLGDISYGTCGINLSLFLSAIVICAVIWFTFYK